MIHPDVVLRQARHPIGFGVFATKRIPRGTITWMLDDLDQRLTTERMTALAPRYNGLLERYTYRDDRGRVILCWDFARFMNHSCAPTCMATGFDFEVAIRDILPGEELTNDYASLHLLPDEAFECHCGEPLCRGRIGPDDADRLADAWRRSVRGALARLGDVDQPLGPIVGADEVVLACAEFNVPVPTTSIFATRDTVRLATSRKT